MKITTSIVGNGILGIAMLAAAPASAVTTPVDLSGWTAEGSGSWTRAPDNNSVTQSVNTAGGTVFYGPDLAQGTRLSGTIRVNTTSDDDFIGFVLGFKAGDITATTTNFILVDWKQTAQVNGGCNGPAGLAISRVSAGLSSNSASWCHLPSAGVTELARASTLGSTGWADNTTYAFDIDFQPNSIKVNVNGVEQFNISGSFANGAFGFYNYSQPNVTYAGLTETVLPPAVPEPASWAMLIAGFGLVGAAARRRRMVRVTA